jgi:hypothetical protein
VTTATLDSMGSLFGAEFGERIDVETVVKLPSGAQSVGQIPRVPRDLRRFDPESYLQKSALTYSECSQALLRRFAVSCGYVSVR